MAENTQQIEPELIIIEQIYASIAIPESHKESYVQHILNNGLTEKMVDELEKIFAAEEKALQEDLEFDQQLLESLNQMIEQEQAETDEEQANILTNVHRSFAEDIQEAKQTLEEVEKDYEVVFEELNKSGESSEIEAIREKLKEDA